MIIKLLEKMRFRPLIIMLNVILKTTIEVLTINLYPKVFKVKPNIIAIILFRYRDSYGT